MVGVHGRHSVGMITKRALPRKVCVAKNLGLVGMGGGDSPGAKAGQNGMEVDHLSINGMKVDRVGEERALLNGVQISKRERAFLR